MLVRDAADRGPTARRVDEAEHHPQGRRLPGAVRPEEAGDRPGLDGEAEPVDRPHLPTEHLGEVVDHDAAVERRRGHESSGTTRVANNSTACGSNTASTK